MSVSTEATVLTEAALGALESFSALLLKSDLGLPQRRSIVQIAWDTARDGDALLTHEDPEASLTASEMALAELGATCLAAAVEAQAASASSAGAPWSRAPRNVKPWEWIRWRVDACARAARSAGVEEEKCESLRNIAATLLEPYRLQFQRLDQEELAALQKHQMRQQQQKEEEEKRQVQRERIEELHRLKESADPDLREAMELEMKELQAQVDVGHVPQDSPGAASTEGDRTQITASAVQPGGSLADGRGNDAPCAEATHASQNLAAATFGDATATQDKPNGDKDLTGHGKDGMPKKDEPDETTVGPQDAKHKKGLEDQIRERDEAPKDHVRDGEKGHKHQSDDSEKDGDKVQGYKDQTDEKGKDQPDQPEQPKKEVEVGKKPHEAEVDQKTGSNDLKEKQDQKHGSQVQKDAQDHGDPKDQNAKADQKDQKPKQAATEGPSKEKEASGVAEVAEDHPKADAKAGEKEMPREEGDPVDKIDPSPSAEEVKVLWVEPSGKSGAEAVWMGPLSTSEVLEMAKQGTLSPDGLVWGLKGGEPRSEPPTDGKGAQPLWQCMPELGLQLRRASEVQLHQNLEKRFKTMPKQEDATDVLPPS